MILVLVNRSGVWRRKSDFWLLVYRAQSWSELARGRFRTSNAVVPQWCSCA